MDEVDVHGMHLFLYFFSFFEKLLEMNVLKSNWHGIIFSSHIYTTNMHFTVKMRKE